MNKPVRVATLALMLMTLIIGVATVSARHFAVEQLAWGTIETAAQSSTECHQSPFGLCATGNATGTIEGDVQVEVLSTVPAVDENGQLAAVYTASIHLETAQGTFDGLLDSQVNLNTGEMHGHVVFIDTASPTDAPVGTLEIRGTGDFIDGQESLLYRGVLYP